MEMIEYIKQYYQSERSMVLVGAAIGLAFILIAFITYRQYGLEQLNKGLIFTLVAGGLFLMSGFFYAFQLNKKVVEVNSFTQTNTELQQTEIQRVEKIIAGSYKLSFIIANVLIVAGIALQFIYPNYLLRGIGLTLLIFGTTLLTIDFFSINNHKIYLESIRKLKF
jgi:hypothetical protein